MTLDLLTIPPPPDFELLMSGTLPAGIISTHLRPLAWRQTRGHLWDPTWLVMHEGIAIPFWFLLGAWIDTGRSHLGRPMRLYLLTRFAFGGLYAALGATLLGNLVQVLFWLGLGGYGIVRGLRWAVRRVNRARGQPHGA